MLKNFSAHTGEGEDFSGNVTSAASSGKTPKPAYPDI